MEVGVWERCGAGEGDGCLRKRRENIERDRFGALVSSLSLCCSSISKASALVLSFSFLSTIMAYCITVSLVWY